MMRVVCFEQLEDICELFVEAVCPHCGRILISLVPDARNIVVFGCNLCGYIDDSAIFSVSNLKSVDNISVVAEDIK